LERAAAALRTVSQLTATFGFVLHLKNVRLTTFKDFLTPVLFIKNFLREIMASLFEPLF
jgi:hypothetical protein